MKLIADIFHRLEEKFGPMGWWPLTDLWQFNTERELVQRGYHPGEYFYPQNEKQIFEICLGAILTQNTSWLQVEKVLLNLNKNKLLHPEKILFLPDDALGELIKSCGYFNQKTRKIKIFLRFFTRLRGRIPLREELLKIWGIGPETADSILLYAYNQPVFVIDAYTKRIFNRILAEEIKDHTKMQDIFGGTFFSLEKEKKVRVFNEYHALIVEQGKQICTRKPQCSICSLQDLCKFNSA